MNCCCGETNEVLPLKESENEEFKGPIKNRVCRDVICLILLVVFCVVGVVYLIIAAVQGDPDRLIRGFDEYGNVCGKKNPTYFDLSQSGQDKSNFPFFDVADKECVSSCDTSSRLKIGFKCLPKIEVDEENFGFMKKLQDSFKNTVEDIKNSWEHILGSCFIGLALSIIVVFLLRFLAPFIVWGTVILIAVGAVAATIALWILYNQNLETKDRESYLIGAIVMTIVAVIVLLILYVLRKRIQLVIQLFIEAGKSVGDMPLLLIQPLWTLLALLVVIAVWAGGWVVIQSSGYFEKVDPDSSSSTLRLRMDEFIAGMRVYHFFGFLWLSQFVVACQSVVIAGAVARWYFSRTKNDLGSPIICSIYRLARFHLGSVAFGSLIIAVIQLIRLIFRVLEKQLGSSNSTVKFFFSCCQCCLYCFEKFMKYISRNAYIIIAIYGYGFCAAARKAFSLLVSNAIRVGAINFVGDFVLLLGKALVTISTVFIAREILLTNDKVISVIPPLIVVGVITFLIAHSFLSVYEMTIDTLFLSFCEDSERNDGVEKPYFMSRGLMRFVENSKKALEADKKRHEPQKGAGNQGPIIHTINIRQPPEHELQEGPLDPRGTPSAAISVESPHRTMKSATPSQISETILEQSVLESSNGMMPKMPLYPPISLPPTPSKLLPLSSA